MTTATLPVFLALLAFGHCGKDKPVFSEDIAEVIQTVHDACVERNGVAEEDLANCEKGIFKDDPKLKCYMYCMLEEASLANEDGSVDWEMLVSLIPEEYAARTGKMLFACTHHDSPGKEKCQRAFDVHKCSYEQDPDGYFLL